MRRRDPAMAFTPVLTLSLPASNGRAWRGGTWVRRRVRIGVGIFGRARAGGRIGLSKRFGPALSDPNTLGCDLRRWAPSVNWPHAEQAPSPAHRSDPGFGPPYEIPYRGVKLSRFSAPPERFELRR